MEWAVVLRSSALENQKQCMAIKTKPLYALQMGSSGNSKIRIQMRLEQ